MAAVPVGKLTRQREVTRTPHLHDGESVRYEELDEASVGKDAKVLHRPRDAVLSTVNGKGVAYPELGVTDVRQ